ncbi:MAG: hypothetical protein ACE5GJ_06895 [Gemmatimonadota bacterium]
MRKSILAAAAALMLAMPVSLFAQGLAVAARGGTLGVGAEAALGLSSNFAIRGGIGLMPFEPSATIDGIDYTLKLPETWVNIGADLYLGGGFRIGAGMLFKPDDPTLTGEVSASKSVTIGDKTYTASDVAQLSGTLDSKDQAPYVLIGFGRHTKSGIGLFLDIGAAFVGDPKVTLSATGNPTVVNSSEFQSELRKQEQNTENDLGSYLKIWPILNLGLKIGLGR